MIRSKQQGFTLIELIMVIVILGILAATALPKFVDLSGDAKQASVKNIAGSLGSASAINKAARLVNPATHGVPIVKCADVINALDGGLSGYTITPASAISDGDTATCTVTDDTDSGVTATFVAHGIS